VYFLAKLGQLVEQAPSNLVDWIRLSTGSYRRLKRGTCGLSKCPASCSACRGWCKEKVHSRSCHWLVINAANTAKVATLSRR